MNCGDYYFAILIYREIPTCKGGIENEVVSVAKEMVEEDPKVKAILLECSALPPYGAAVQETVNLPVFDFITMINYVYSAIVKKKFKGFM